MDYEKLREFLKYAKLNSYANENAEYKVTNLNSKRIEIERDEFLFIDEYVGENPFSGVETVFYKSFPLWQMHYYGWVIDEDPEETYKFLRMALKNIDETNPIRGKSNFIDGDFRYIVNISGDLKKFEGREYIYKGIKNIYECVFFGGLVK